jgi:hypothetical protein
MTEITQEQRDEMAKLRIETEQARAHNKRARFSQEYRSRVLALRQQGVTYRHFWEELRLGGSVVSGWEKQAAPTNDSGDAPRVIPVRTASQSGPEAHSAAAPQALSLRLGAFCLTIRVA